MKLLRNIKLKYSKAETIVTLNKFFNIGIKKSYDIVNEMIDSYHFDISDEEAMNIKFGKGSQDVKRILETFIDFEYIESINSVLGVDTDYEYSSNHNIREPDEATKEALAWLEEQSEEVRERIKLIGQWDNPICVAVC